MPQKWNISETREDRGKVTTEALGLYIGTHKRSFERYHPQPPMASSSPRLGFATPTQILLLLYQKRVKLRTSNLAGTFVVSIHRVHPNKSPLKVLEGVSRDCSKF